MYLSNDALANTSYFGWNAIQVIDFLCHSSVLINVLLSICHILIVASLDPLAKSKPFYLKARQVIEPICDLLSLIALSDN